MRKSNGDLASTKVTPATNYAVVAHPFLPLSLTLIISLPVSVCSGRRARFIGRIDLKMTDRPFLNEAATATEGRWHLKEPPFSLGGESVVPLVCLF